MKRLLILVSLLALLMAATSVLAQKGGEEEDEDPFTLYVSGLEEGVAFESEFLTDGDAHVYAFNGSAGDVVTITLQPVDGDTFFDAYLVLLGQRGEVYAYNDDSSRSGDPALSSAIVDYELLIDGTYYVLATTYGGRRSSEGSTEGPLPYVIEASGFTLPAGDEDGSYSYAGATLEIGGSATLAITLAEPVYYVTFTGAAGDVIDIRTDTSNGSANDTLLYLFDNNGVRLAANDDSNGLDAEILSFELPEDGIYMIYATSYSFPDAADGSFSGEGDFDLFIDAGESSK